MIRQGFKLKEGRYRLSKKEILHYEGGGILEQVAQKLKIFLEISYISGNVEGQTGCGPEQPGLVKDHIHDKGVGLNYL